MKFGTYMIYVDKLEGEYKEAMYSLIHKAMKFNNKFQFNPSVWIAPKIEVYAIDIYPICLYEQQGNSTFVSVRHTHFKAKIGVPPFPCTVGVE